MHEFFFENLRNPAHSRRAGLMRQFRSSQLDSTTAIILVVSGYHGMRAPTKFSTGTFVRRGMVVGMVVGMTTRIPRYSCTTRESEE